MQTTSRFFIFVIAAFSLVNVTPAFALPSRVIVIRHAEKPDDDHEPDLSERGRERAAELPSLFAQNSVLREQPHIDVIYAMKAPKVGGTRRPMQTVQPLSRALHLNVNNEIQHVQINEFIEFIKTNPELDGKVVLICWNREGPPAFAEGFGVSDIPKWKKKTFDRFWVFDFDRAQLINFRDLPQQLLPGDSDI